MSEAIRPPVTELIAEQAADWLTRLQSDQASDADWLAFGDWLDESPEHLAAYEQIERISLDADEVVVKGLLKPALAKTPAIRLSPRKIRTSKDAAVRWLPWSVAAVAALVLIAMVPVLHLEPQTPKPATEIYQTAKGQLRTVLLADGTRINLNSGSIISVRLEPDVRRVAMGAGEAIFDVAKDANRPFLISVGDREVRVVGTEFDILRLANRTVVTVRRGVVAVSPQGGAVEAQLVRGQQLDHVDGQAASIIRTADTEQSFAWRLGRVIYDDRPLSEVVADLNRRFSTPIRMGDPSVGQIRFSGVLVVDSEDAVVRRLQDFLPIRAEQSQGAILLWPAKR